MKYSEAEKQIKALSDKYDIDMGDGDFNIVYNGNIGSIYVSDSCQYNLNIGSFTTFSKLPFSNKLYMILAELASTPLDERVEEKKYYVQVFNNAFGYLNIITLTGEMVVSGMPENYGYKTKFTDKEIEELKQRDDIPLDWNKVSFVEAK
ncbi:hypothetical protein IMAU10058_03011 [Lactiplantibacillus plantarum]|nr:hypothetical protein [Lactiplantibacillus plantarum]